MVFYPMLLLGIYLCLRHSNIEEIGAPLLGGLAVMPMIVGAFFAYWVFVRHELMWLDIIIYIAAMVGAVQLAKRWRNSRVIRNRWPLWLVVIVFIMVLTGFLTYHAPDWLIFANLG